MFAMHTLNLVYVFYSSSLRADACISAEQIQVCVYFSANTSICKYNLYACVNHSVLVIITV